LALLNPRWSPTKIRNVRNQREFAKAKYEQRKIMNKARHPRPTPSEAHQIPNRDGSLPFPKKNKSTNSSSTQQTDLSNANTASNASSNSSSSNETSK